MLLVAIVLLVLGSGYFYRSYRQEKQEEANLDTEYASVDRQVRTVKRKFAEYNIIRPAEVISRLEEVLGQEEPPTGKRGELVLASQSYFPQRVEEPDLFDLIVSEAGADISLDKLETSPSDTRTIGTSEYKALQFTISAHARSELLPLEQLNQIKEWLKGIEEDTRVKTLDTGDILLNFDGATGTWSANFRVTVLTQ